MKKNNVDWLLFLSLEKDFINTINYVEICEQNRKTYSIVYLKLIISICSSIEKLGKKYCKEINSSFASKTNPDIKDINITIINYNSKFPEIKCEIPRYGIELSPWEKWLKKETPDWWTAYNNVKHNNDSYEDATQENVINALAGLFCLNLYYYKEDLYSGDINPLPDFFDYERMPGHLAVNPGAELPGFPRNSA